jgi:hypothetical protein
MAKLLGFLAVVFACGAAAGAADQPAESVLGKAVPRPEQVAALRARGPDGLAEALRVYDELRQEQSQRMFSCAALSAETSSDGDTNLEAWRAAIDQIGGQRGCTVSRLYWYTDLEKAKAAAERSGRPILSLRMLGKLTDEFSCANSRFFRTALYSNKDISEFLRVNYILHWQSVRPVPRVTIDFGDGRKLERTLTGNSAHYVLASDGTPLDVLPGLYSPLAFRQWLWDLRTFQLDYAKLSANERPGKLREFHSHRRDELLRRWDSDIQRLGETRTELVSTRITSSLASARLAGQQVPADPAPKAVKAAARAVGKTAAEQPVMRFANLGGTWMERGMDDELWKAIADLHREDVHLDESSVALMRQEFPRAAVAGRVATTKRAVEDPVLRIVRAFEDSMSLDTVRNEYLLHRRVHERLAESATGTMDFNELNEWVYAELFLTPSKDPWLGLAPSDVYTALDGDGRVEPAKQAASSHGG